MRVVLTGAGISTAAGIPDFRSEGGLWDRFDPMEFHIDRFHADPGHFWDRRAELISAAKHLDAEPTSAHRALAAAVQDGRIHTIVTQNVDGLHARAGTPPDCLIEVHGNGAQTICMDCGALEDMRRSLAERTPGKPPACPCGGIRKPNVVLFGEPVTRMEDAIHALQDATELIVIGTSLQVHPVAGLVAWAAASQLPITILNHDPTPYDAMSEVIRGDVQETVPALLESMSL